MTPVFLDTVGLLAIWDVRDQWHAVASGAFEKINNKDWFPVTTPLILFECANAASRRLYRNSVVRIQRALTISDGIINPLDAEVVEAWKQYEAGAAGDPGVVDLISFQVMRRQNIHYAFTNDKHFRAFGFSTLF